MGNEIMISEKRINFRHFAKEGKDFQNQLISELVFLFSKVGEHMKSQLNDGEIGMDQLGNC